MLKAITAITKRGESSNSILSRLRNILDIRYFALLAAISTYALIVLGGVVRATDSGLACPDWPLCHGQLIPPMETSIIIEYSHRLTAVSVGLLILGVALAVWIWHRNNRPLLIGMTASVILLIVQALIGAATVDQKLSSSIVALHLATGLTLFAILIFNAAWSFRPTSNISPSDRLLGSSRPTNFQIVAVTIAMATLALILLGSYVSNEGAGLAYPDWPLFDGGLISTGGYLANLHYAHRIMAAAIGLAMLAVVFKAWSTRQPPLARYAMTSAFALYIAQVFIGASNIWLDLATIARVAHLALASALWGLLVTTVVWSRLHQRRLTQQF